VVMRQPSPKNSDKISLAEKFVSRVTRWPRYNCIERCWLPLCSKTPLKLTLDEPILGHSTLSGE
jgi:hypothetical protein